MLKQPMLNVPRLVGHQDPSDHLLAASQTPGWEIQDKYSMTWNRDVTEQQDRSLSALSQDKNEQAKPAHFC